MARALWLPDYAASYGVRIEEIYGWQTLGAETFHPDVVIAHHTASGGSGAVPSLGICRNGRGKPGTSGYLPGPLCQWLLGRDAVARLIACGRANHAGSGSWKGFSGNSNAIGIEAENNGRGEQWSNAVLDAYYALVAAMLDGINREESHSCGHKEWTSRKIDPYPLDMNVFRSRVRSKLIAPTPPVPQPPKRRQEMFFYQKEGEPTIYLVNNKLRPFHDWGHFLFIARRAYEEWAHLPDWDFYMKVVTRLPASNPLWGLEIEPYDEDDAPVMIGAPDRITDDLTT